MRFNRSEPRVPHGLRAHIEAEAAARARVRFSEESVLSICTVLFLEREVSFLRGMPRMATIKQDHAGIDIVCPSDVGDLYLQVKSSHWQAMRFIQKRRSRKIPLGIVVVDRTDPIITTKRVIGALHRTRAAVVRSRALRRGYQERSARA